MRSPKGILGTLVVLAVGVEGARVAATKPAARALSAYNKAYGSCRPGTFYYVDEDYQKKTFAEISRLYGEETAADMVERVPEALCFNRKDFEQALKEFGEVFGEEEAKAMVIRNPSLLSVPAAYGREMAGSAATATDQTMYFSYLVAWTRPLGGLWLAILFSLLSIPVIEGVTGVPRTEFLTALQNLQQ